SSVARPAKSHLPLRNLLVGDLGEKHVRRIDALSRFELIEELRRRLVGPWNDLRRRLNGVMNGACGRRHDRPGEMPEQMYEIESHADAHGCLRAIRFEVRPGCGSRDVLVGRDPDGAQFAEGLAELHRVEMLRVLSNATVEFL